MKELFIGTLALVAGVYVERKYKVSDRIINGIIDICVPDSPICNQEENAGDFTD